MNEIRKKIYSLCMYKNLFKDKTGKKLLKLLDDLNVKDDEILCLKDYNDLAYDIMNRNVSMNFLEIMIEDMLLSTNPIHKMIENNENLNDDIFYALKHELTLLDNIFHVNGKELLNLIQRKFPSIEEKDIFLWKNITEYQPKNDMPFEKMKAQFMNAKQFSDLTSQLIEYHKVNGTGRSTAFKAFVWERMDKKEDGRLREIEYVDPISLSDLIGYESQKKTIIENTLQFLHGGKANNLLLYGSRGTGKSSTIKAVLNEFYQEGLRLIEVEKDQLSDFTRIIQLLRHKKQKFIVFVDDLVFEEHEPAYSALKTILEGSVEQRADNIVIYATTNRRHLMKETFSDRNDEEINGRDTVEEKLSLADRFGITISFYTPDQKHFFEIVKGLAVAKNLDIDDDTLYSRAVTWSMQNNGRSPRSANQYISYLEGEMLLKNRN